MDRGRQIAVGERDTSQRWQSRASEYTKRQLSTHTGRSISSDAAIQRESSGARRVLARPLERRVGQRKVVLQRPDI